MPEYERTINWDDYWQSHDHATEEGEIKGMRQGGENMADRLGRFFEEVPETFVSVGCGYAFTLFALARKHEHTSFLGVDISQPVVELNRERAADDGLSNLRFDVGALPDLDLERDFHCVYCYATLHYVENSASALRVLYEHVRPNGTLIAHYPNRYSRANARRADGVEERFELVLEGENLLSYDRIEATTGQRPRNFWRAAGEENWRDLGRNMPYDYAEPVTLHLAIAEGRTAPENTQRMYG